MERLKPLVRLAVTNGLEPAVREHIRRGIDPNARDASGCTALLLAASNGHGIVCQLLLDAGADLEATDSAGRSALDLATSHGHVEVVALLRQRKALSQPEMHSPSADVWAGIPDEFDWEEDTDAELPAKCSSTVISDAIALQRSISGHAPADRDEDWLDVVIVLPTLAPRIQTLLEEHERRSLREALVAGLSSGMLPRWRLHCLFESETDSVDPALENALLLTVGDLDLLVDDGYAYDLRDCTDAEPAVEAEADAALDQIEALLSEDYEPLVLYRRDCEANELLSGEQELALSREMEQGVDESLKGLAQWRFGLGSVVSALEQIGSGMSPRAHMFGSDTADGLDGSVDIEADDAAASAKTSSDGLDPNARAFIAAVLSGNDTNDQRLAIVDALRDLGLSREFLLSLSDHAPTAERHTVGWGAMSSGLARMLAAWREMVVRNLRLVMAIARKYSWGGVPLLDLIQEGNIGLMRAAHKFDYRRGLRFSTLATWWIRQGVTRAIDDHGRTIRVPVHMLERIRRIAVQRQQYEHRHGRAPSDADLAAALEISEQQVRRAAQAEPEPLDMQLPTLRDTGITIGDAVPAGDGSDPELRLEHDRALCTLDELLAGLTPREADVVRLRFGLSPHGSDHTLEEVGAMFGVTRERIRQIEAKAIRKLQHPSRARRLRRAFGYRTHA